MDEGDGWRGMWDVGGRGFVEWMWRGLGWDGRWWRYILLWNGAINGGMGPLDVRFRMSDSCIGRTGSAAGAGLLAGGMFGAINVRHT